MQQRVVGQLDAGRHPRRVEDPAVDELGVLVQAVDDELAGLDELRGPRATASSRRRSGRPASASWKTSFHATGARATRCLISETRYCGGVSTSSAGSIAWMPASGIQRKRNARRRPSPSTRQNACRPLKRAVAKLSGGSSVAAALIPAIAYGRGARNASSRSGFGRPPGSSARCAETIARKSSGVRGGNAGDVQRRPVRVIARRQLEAHAEPERVAALGRLAVGQVRARAAVGDPHDAIDRLALQVLGGRQRRDRGRRRERTRETPRRARARA